MRISDWSSDVCSSDLGLLRSQRVSVPVIIVGNIFVGGTGKTPLTIWLAHSLRAAGFRPGVISRGYGGKGASVLEVHPDSSSEKVGDEPLLIAQRADRKSTRLNSRY